MKKADIITALFLLVTGLMMIFVIIPAQTYPGEEYGVPPATVPTAAMAVVTFMAGILLVQRLLDRRKNKKDTPSPMKRSQWLHIAGFTVLLSAGLAAIKFLHFVRQVFLQRLGHPARFPLFHVGSAPWHTARIWQEPPVFREL